MLAVWAWRVPGGTGTLGADVIFLAHPTGELGVSTGPVLSGTGMHPPDEARGTLTLRNQTAATLDVRLRGLPSGGNLDDLLRVEVVAGDRPLFLGTLGGLRTWTETPLLLPSGGTATLSVRAWLPAEVRGGYEGRVEQVSLELRPTPVGG